MAKFYTLSPEGVPENQVLFPTIRPYFISQGHFFVDRIEEADVVLLDFHSRVSPYSELDVSFLLNKDVPVVTFDEWDRGGMSSDEWPTPLTWAQQDIFNNLVLQSIPSVHFCRLLNKTKTNYPTNLYPYEKPISYCETILSPDDLFEREYDIVYIANSAPSRESIAQAIRSDGRFKYVILIGEDKIPFEDFLQIHKKGKLFISSAAGGFTDERMQCLFSISGMIRQRTDQLLANDFTHLENCIRISSPPTKEELDTIYEIVNNKDRLFEIYQNQYTFVKKYYSQEYLANYYLSTMQKHGVI